MVIDDDGIWRATLLSDAYARFREFSNSPANHNTFYRFNKLINGGAEIFFTEEAIRRMVILVGPHGRTFCKALMVQNDET